TIPAGVGTTPSFGPTGSPVSASTNLSPPFAATSRSEPSGENVVHTPGMPAPALGSVASAFPPGVAGAPPAPDAGTIALRSGTEISWTRSPSSTVARRLPSRDRLWQPTQLAFSETPGSG